MTDARVAPLHGLSVTLLPFDDARSTTQIRALVTSGHSPDGRNCGGLPSGVGGVAPATRLHLTSFRPLRLPLARRQRHTETNFNPLAPDNAQACSIFIVLRGRDKTWNYLSQLDS